MQREELQIQFWQSQTALARKIFGRDDALVPDDVFGRVERHLIQLLELRRPTLVSRYLKLKRVFSESSTSCSTASRIYDVSLFSFSHLPAARAKTRCPDGTNSPRFPVPSAALNSSNSRWISVSLD